MKNSFVIIIVSLILMSAHKADAQYKYEYFAKGKVQLVNKKKLRINEIKFSDQSLTAINKKNGKKIEIPYYELKKIKVQGNNRMFWEGLGAGLATSIVLTTIIVASQGHPNDMEHYISGLKRTGPVLGALGGMIGLTIKRYDPIPLDNLMAPGTNPVSLNYQVGMHFRF